MIVDPDKVFTEYNLNNIRCTQLNDEEKVYAILDR